MASQFCLVQPAPGQKCPASQSPGEGRGFRAVSGLPWGEKLPSRNLGRMCLTPTRSPSVGNGNPVQIRIKSPDGYSSGFEIPVVPSH